MFFFQTWIKQVFITRNIVAKDIVSFPSTKKWKSGSEIKLYRITEHPHVWCWDVTNFISVVNIICCCWQHCLGKQNHSLVLQITDWIWINKGYLLKPINPVFLTYAIFHLLCTIRKQIKLSLYGNSISQNQY